ncbi:hypothetical protein SAMN05444266_101779 [Chitinophaga jiangningensis]|uniref:Uncharacterized protein n=1 Tax=Chitinophaga jiangningensis TaxID=1419482 RepID=A0A1M6WV24_9BACT|nr:hypothetical protein [Chitinophaga jiangningensis]SHK97587.1 hypothetical protein SAMN05444266_101779 [Chitinophaga jiangningensis]
MLFHYYRMITALNLPFSLAAAVLAWLATDYDWYIFLRTFGTGWLTGGFFMALFLFQLRYNHLYYFYHNKGYSRTRLIVWSYVINVCEVITLVYAYKLIHAYVTPA